MSLFPFMNDVEGRPAQAARLAPKLRALSERGVYFGTGTWRYEGWLGSIYTRARYEKRRRFSHTEFDKKCLTEYAETFPITGGDFSFYQFSSADYWKQLFEATPSSFLFGLKVPEEITAARWPSYPRYGERAGTKNENFLNAELFRARFTNLLEPYAGRLATLNFEFGALSRAVFPTPEHFLERLDAFLAALPSGFRYGVEVRNAEYLGPNYFALLASHGVAHILNAWSRMPELGDQLELPGVFTADFVVVRALVSKGRAYEQAVRAFSPYDRVRAVDPAAREGLRHVVERARWAGKPAFILVGNRLEGHAPTTIEAVVDQIEM